MSVTTAKSKISSILRTQQIRNSEIESSTNRVSFDLFKNHKIDFIIKDVQKGNSEIYDGLCRTMSRTTLEDTDLINILQQANNSVHLLDPKFSQLVKLIIKTDSLSRKNKTLCNLYHQFIINILITHNKYTRLAIEKLILDLVPGDDDQDDWLNGTASEEKKQVSEYSLKILYELIDLIPMTFEVIIEQTEKKFPYYKRPSHVLVGYIKNLFILIQNKPVFQIDILQLIVNNLLLLDFNSPRSEIEEAELEHEESIEEGAHCEEDFLESKNRMAHAIAETYDLCLNILLEFIENKFKQNSEENDSFADKFYSMFILIFETVVIPAHKPQHLQYVIFYLCSFKIKYSEMFLKFLWHKVCNPNVVPEIRQTCVCYISSFLARAKYLPIGTLKAMLKEICSWAHNYIEQSDFIKNDSLKAHTVFYAVCQAIFYIIAFRSRILTEGKRNLLFLQSLQLSSLVTCHLNPLRVCLPTVVQAFAGISRAYQLAYCHTVIEKNIRKKLATIYTNATEKPDESIEQFFPYDPCLLKRTNIKIEPLFLKYQKCTTEFENNDISNADSVKRKHLDSEMSEIDDNDDFLSDNNKKIKLDEFNKNLSYIYPGFNK